MACPATHRARETRVPQLPDPTIVGCGGQPVRRVGYVLATGVVGSLKKRNQPAMSLQIAIQAGRVRTQAEYEKTMMLPMCSSSPP